MYANFLETFQLLPYNTELEVILKLMQTLCVINNLREDRLNYQTFYWPDLADYADVQQEYVKWIMADTASEFNICNFSFLFDHSAGNSAGRDCLWRQSLVPHLQVQCGIRLGQKQLWAAGTE